MNSLRFHLLVIKCETYLPIKLGFLQLYLIQQRFETMQALSSKVGTPDQSYPRHLQIIINHMIWTISNIFMAHTLWVILYWQQYVSKAAQNTHKMTDGWLQFETEPSIVHDCIFTLVSKSRMGKSPNPKCQTPNLRFCTMVSLKHFSRVKFHFGLPSKRV